MSFNDIAFRAISNFIKALTSVHGSEDHQLKLYNGLIKKTTFDHTVAIKKHIAGFKKFCTANRDSILHKNLKLMKEKNIKYSERVCINVYHLMEISDKDIIETIWTHLLTILAILDPASSAKQILKESKSKEASLFTDLLEKVESKVDLSNQSNPMELLSSVMTSGILPEIMETIQHSMQDGKLDPMSLLTSMQNMMGGNEPDSPLGGIDLMGMMNQLMPQMVNTSSSIGAVSTPAPEISSSGETPLITLSPNSEMNIDPVD